MTIWEKYQSFSRNFEATEPMRLAIRHMRDTKGKQALDFGASVLRDAKFMRRCGFHVTTLTIPQFEEASYPPDSYDFISAQASLPFIPHTKFSPIWSALLRSLKSGGIITGNFFGTKHSWNAHDEVNGITFIKARELLQGLEIIRFNVKEFYAGVGYDNKPSRWEVFEFIARKM